MTVSKSINRTRLSISGYDYDFTFRIDAETELLVYTLDSEGEATLLTYGTDYIVTDLDAANQEGTIQTGSYVESVWTPAEPDGTEILIIRNKPYTQTADIPVRGGFNESVIELALDNIVMQIQQLKEIVDYAVDPDPTAASDAQMAAETAQHLAEAAQTAAEAAQTAAELAQTGAEGAATAAVASVAGDLEDALDTTTGHDHDGSNSKKIDYGDLLNVPTIGSELFTEDGTFTVPAGVTVVYITMVGGGGGGGGAIGTSGGGGGGGESVINFPYTVTPEAEYAVTVGAGGAGGSGGADGTAGGNSTFDTAGVVATGGAKGAAAGTAGAGGGTALDASGVTAGGSHGIKGGNGANGSGANGGGGGGTPFGTGGAGATGANVGSPGTGYGAGGGGGGADTSPGRVGGAGKAGFVLVMY